MSLVNREEVRRLEKAAREKDKRKLVSWAEQFERQLENIFRTDYEKAYKEQTADTVDNLMIAVAYTLHFSEETRFGSKKLPSFMEDLFVTIDMYRTGEYRPEDYAEELKRNGIVLDHYDYDRIYKKYLDMYDTDLVRYLRSKHRKIITICGSSKFKDEILTAQRELELDGNMVFIDGVFEHADKLEIMSEEKQFIEQIHLEKILISDAIYVVNKDGYIGESTKQEIEYAKEHNKEIMYMEPIDKNITE